MVSFGIWGLIPPVLTITLAFITKDVMVSLFLGILSGTLIVAGGNPIIAILNLTDMLAGSLNDGWNIRIFLFCALLGGLVGMLSKTGSARAFGRWAADKLNSPKTSLLMAWFCGLVIFIDDYFNSLAVGTVMRPITDKNNVPRAQLAYILDSTAAPVCILVPISSWVITVMSIVKGSEGFSSLGISEFEFFMRSVPFNIYAILTLIMVLTLILTGRNFGPMAKSIKYAKETGKLYNEDYGPAPGEIEVEGEQNSSKARPMDMLFPILVLIASAVILFPMTTYLGAIDGESITSLGAAMGSMSLGDAFNNTDASMALFYAVIFTLLITYIYYTVRKLFTIKSASDAIGDGIKSMVPALIILTMAWTIGSVIKSSPEDGGLGLAAYLSEVVVGGGFPIALIPVIAFALSALISFSTGTSWGTFAIMIPIVMPIVVGLAQAKGLMDGAMLNSVLISISAVLGGSVFGDHASPISDTTILSSTGAGCPHLEHVATQMPYAITCAVCAFIGFLIGGIFLNLFVAWLAALGAFVLALVFLPRIYKA
ncbi:Na+/H+ antiporter [Sphaerochaeta pleomorpha str. Grapes]|uniref:Na+/H+ antiporter n=1 Tax=Sphaerochaeta pleomorpha (strain ATCC BAA-1885 / DSM 22778 / Grapes) TaxID=158190 RepID=G8QSL5_SPHPG|nr:Na+/H+ antiporter NhaC family protein [Sphaerochaeta pleomorpha]AEV28976.1 Na+/H+ antiporter [Sphaerochaeta pleomorpha str. Grapes]